MPLIEIGANCHGCFLLFETQGSMGVGDAWAEKQEFRYFAAVGARTGLETLTIRFWMNKLVSVFLKGISSIFPEDTD